MNRGRIWTIGAVFAIAAVLGLGWLVGLSPLLTQAEAADTERSVVDSANLAQSVALATMKEQYENIESLRAELKDIETSIPAEVDADYVYSVLAGYQAGSGATVSAITTAEAIQYGIPATTDGGEAVAAVQAPGALATTLYTVPVTITFDGAEAGPVLAFVKAMQTGPRLFLVTQVTGNGVGDEAGSATVTAYMFVIHDPAIAGEGAEAAAAPAG